MVYFLALPTPSIRTLAAAFPAAINNSLVFGCFATAMINFTGLANSYFPVLLNIPTILVGYDKVFIPVKSRKSS
jgi:hypothetical protein